LPIVLSLLLVSVVLHSLEFAQRSEPSQLDSTVGLDLAYCPFADYLHSDLEDEALEPLAFAPDDLGAKNAYRVEH
jgi:hypothetical protein